MITSDEIIAYGKILAFIIMISAAILFPASQNFFIIKSIFALNWNKTSGKILKCGINEWEDDGINYEAVIEYSYSVDNKEYSSKKIMFGFQNFASNKDAEYLYNTFKDKSEIDVYYKPNKHNKSVLLVGLIKPHFRTLLISGIWGIVVLLMFGLTITSHSS